MSSFKDCLSSSDTSNFLLGIQLYPKEEIFRELKLIIINYLRNPKLYKDGIISYYTDENESTQRYYAINFPIELFSIRIYQHDLNILIEGIQNNKVYPQIAEPFFSKRYFQRIPNSLTLKEKTVKIIMDNSSIFDELLEAIYNYFK